ncbi:SoxR reducing system RseC family protein [Candidatus Caldatribacterium sp. SIUC1]|uniref:SoxR reducing system RseC family protein n=1 Tax=Candidatus Caldatribacterium sp. SIUC1 TaxID=3418365 RepID=UPI003F68E130
MRQMGKVLHTEGEYALVRVEKRSGCGGERCPLSSPFVDDSGSDFYTVRARNDAHAHPGDTVFVEIRDTVALSIAFFLYLFPILLALGVYLLLSALFARQALALFGLFGSLGGSFLFLRWLNSRLAIDYRVSALARPEACNQCPLQPGKTPWGENRG